MLTFATTEAEEAGGKVTKLQWTLELAQVSKRMRKKSVAPNTTVCSPSWGDSGRKKSWCIPRRHVCPQDSLHHPRMLMPPCQWRYINIAAPLSSLWHWWHSVTHIEYTALIPSFRFVLVLPVVLFHSACAALSFWPYYGMYFSAQHQKDKMKCSSHLCPV